MHNYILHRQTENSSIAIINYLLHSSKWSTNWVQFMHSLKRKFAKILYCFCYWSSSYAAQINNFKTVIRSFLMLKRVTSNILYVNRSQHISCDIILCGELLCYIEAKSLWLYISSANHKERTSHHNYSSKRSISWKFELYAANVNSYRTFLLQCEATGHQIKHHKKINCT